MDHEIISWALAGTAVSEFIAFDSIGSTNDEALDWLNRGSPDWALVVADEQTQGHGRFTRHWVTNPGSALAFSLILKAHNIDPLKLSLFSPLCGVAIHEALKAKFNLITQIKWPNDVLFDEQKFAGILVEAVWHNTNLVGLVLGIGINITPGSIPAPEQLSFPATCLESALGHPLDRFSLLHEILLSIQKWSLKVGSVEFFNVWDENLAFKGHRVKIEHSEKSSIIGIEKGINQNGSLVLIQDDGTEIPFEIGDVHLRIDGH
jgi:BirA family transcriptional regulator, biotin operon repressor / biotin---[acetyl-CoA-carboxylase] ligase